MADRILADLPDARWVRLPDGEDVRSMLQAGRVDELDELLAEADSTAELRSEMDEARHILMRAQIAQARRLGYCDAAARGWAA